MVHIFSRLPPSGFSTVAAPKRQFHIKAFPNNSFETQNPSKMEHRKLCAYDVDKLCDRNRFNVRFIVSNMEFV